MKRQHALPSLILISLAFSACSLFHKNTPPPPITIAPQPPKQTEATPNPIRGADLLAQQPAEIREAVDDHERGGEWQTFTTDHSQIFPYNEGDEPVVDCEPLRTTDIQLQGGETITDVAMGDTERWQATPAASGDPKNPVPHLAVKPQAAGIKTNLTIYTTRHIYHLNLRSRPGHGIEEVEPMDGSAQVRDPKFQDRVVAESRALLSTVPI